MSAGSQHDDLGDQSLSDRQNNDVDYIYRNMPDSGEFWLTRIDYNKHKASVRFEYEPGTMSLLSTTMRCLR